MGLFSTILIGVSLSMDAFAVSLCVGMGMVRLRLREAVSAALVFGGFQALMPLLGWAFGERFESRILRFDHWIIFGLLVLVGGKMIIDSRGEEDGKARQDDFPAARGLLTMAFATSLDALAVGITFSLLPVRILFAVSVIGLTAFSLSLSGVVIGNRFGARYKNGAQTMGGAALILIGLKILLEHMA